MLFVDTPAVADVAALSVISSGIVGVLGAGTAFYSQRVTLRNERAKRIESRRDDLRAVLDEAAKTATPATALLTSSDGGPESGRITDLLAQLQRIHAGTEPNVARLGVRLGSTEEAYKQYRAFSMALLRLWLVAQDKAALFTETANAEGPIDKDEFYERMKALNAAYASAALEATTSLDTFIDEAARLAGALTRP